jgi:hypothetical protein
VRYLRPGESTNLVIRTSAVGGFNGQINLSCSPVAGITCAFNPATILSRIKHCIFLQSDGRVPDRLINGGQMPSQLCTGLKSK